MGRGSGTKFDFDDVERVALDDTAAAFHALIPEPVIRTLPDGKREWYLKGHLHREDGPAVEWEGGKREWWRNDKRHREDGPAFESADGTTREWWRNGQLHREDGPAVEHADGTREWWRDGKPFSHSS
jgi:hypothetical protein